jgi:hypothetical protein
VHRLAPSYVVWGVRSSHAIGCSNVLSQSGVVRSDIRTSLVNSAKTPGVPLTVKLKILKGANVKNGFLATLTVAVAL